MTKLLRFLPALLWMGVIYQSSATPGLKTVPLVQRTGLLPALDPSVTWWLEWVLRKSAHLFSYALLALLLLWGFAALLERRRALWAALVIAIVYAISDEIHQSFVPERQGRWYDVAIDALGAGLALWLSRRRPWNQLRPEADRASTAKGE